MKKLLSMLLCAVVFVCAIGTVYADTDDVGSEAADAASEEAYRVSEITELREANSDTYLLSDGNYECVVYSTDKYYLDENGEYREISNKIVAEELTRKDRSYGFANEANGTKVYFSDTEPSVMISSGTNELSFKMAGTKSADTEGTSEEFESAANVKVSIGAKCNDYCFEDFELQGEDCITYADVLKSTDVVYSVGTGYVKEYLIIKDSAAPSEFSFEYDTDSYALKLNESGTVDVYDSDGKQIFELDSLFAVDSDGAYTEAVEYRVHDDGNGTTAVTVSVDEDWLYSEERSFPVLIDPTAIVSGGSCTKDSYVVSSNPNANFGWYDVLKTGRTSYGSIRRSYIKFDLPSYITSDMITSSYISIRKKARSNPRIRAYRITGSWNSTGQNGITWNNRPGYTSTYASGTAALQEDDWYKMTVTNIVKRWYSGTYPNYGVVLRDPYDTSLARDTTFYSSDALYPNRPELHIYYESLECWYSDTDTIGKWTYSPKVWYKSYCNYSDSSPFRQGLTNGKKIWNKALGLTISITNSDSTAPIKYYFGTAEDINRLGIFGTVEDNILGLTITSHSYYKEYYYNGTVKCLYRIESAIGFVVKRSYLSDDNYIKTVSHEMGHALGWFGHPSSTQPKWVMQQGILTNKNLSTSEKRHLAQVYGK